MFEPESREQPESREVPHQGREGRPTPAGEELPGEWRSYSLEALDALDG